MKQLLLSLQPFATNRQSGSKHFYFALLISVFLFVTHSEQVSANHSAGGYISYQWLSGSTYRFTVTFYKDCGGATPAPNEMEIWLVSLGCGARHFNAPRIPGTGQEIGYPCPNTTTCSGGTNPGYRKFVYQVDFTLDITCPSFAVYFKPSLADNSNLGRNNGITTLVPDCVDPNPPYGPVQCNLYTESILDFVNHPTNKSVTFTNDPIFYVCAGQKAVINLGAKDPDGDSLYYELVNAKKKPSNVVYDVTYVSPLSGIDPLFPAGSVSIDHTTGDITINTNVTQIGVIDVKVKEYKNGVLAGSVVLESQVIVNSCANNYPSVTGVNGTAVYTDSVCPGSTVNFTVNSNDVDAGQVVTMTWNNGIPLPASFSISGSPHPVGTFTWTTTPADARPQPYIFTVTVKDNSCPLNGYKNQSYAIYVTGTAVTVGPSNPSICNGQSVSLNASGASSYSWSPATGLSATTGSAVSANPSATTTYTVTGSNNGACNSTATVVVNVTPLAASAKPADTTVCYGSFVPLNASGGTTYNWLPSAGLNYANIQNPVAYATSVTTYTVTVSSGSCQGTATVNINVLPNLPAPQITLGHDTLFCSVDPKYTSYQWYFNSALIPGATGTFYLTSQNGNYNVAVTDVNGCSIAVGINIIIAGMQDNYLQSSFILSPNPATNELRIYSNSLLANSVVSIFNVLGETLLDEKIEKSNNISMNIKNLPAGIYFLQLRTESGTVVKRFVKE